MIYTPSIERAASGLLDEAAAVAADHPDVLRRIEDERRMWQRAKTILAAIRQERAASKAE